MPLAENLTWSQVMLIPTKPDIFHDHLKTLYFQNPFQPTSNFSSSASPSDDYCVHLLIIFTYLITYFYRLDFLYDTKVT